MVEGFKTVPTLQHLTLHVAAYLASSHRLETSGEEWEEGDEGGAQGDSELSAGFTVARQPAARELHRELAAMGGLPVLGNDDGYAIAPREELFGAVGRFKEKSFAIFNLTLQVSKTKLYMVSGEKPAGAPQDMPRAGVLVGDGWLPFFQCYRVDIGSREGVHHIFGEKVEEFGQDVANIVDLLQADNHTAWVLLSTSLSQQLDYLLTLQYPSIIKLAAEALDAKLWEVLEYLAGQDRIPQGEE
jgi:hypothetical protein